jgi:sigma-B regulation protein RsbU (phosphoserine phosphatase)
MALGVDRDIEINQQIVPIAPGDKILFYTDGVTEAFAEDGALFGEERLHEAIRTMDTSAAGMLDVINTTLDGFIGDQPPADDITMVSVKRIS